MSFFRSCGLTAVLLLSLATSLEAQVPRRPLAQPEPVQAAPATTPAPPPVGRGAGTPPPPTNTGHAVCQSMSPVAFADFIRTGSPAGKCNISPDSIVRMYDRLFPELGFDSRAAMADYFADESRYDLRLCSEVAGTTTKVKWGRILINPGRPPRTDINPNGAWERTCVEREELVCDLQLGKCISSTICWNPPLDDLSIVPVAVQDVTRVVPPLLPPRLDPQPRPVWTGPLVVPPARVDTVYIKKSDGFDYKKWGLITGGVIGGGCLLLQVTTDDACITIRVRARAGAGSGSGTP